MIGGGEVIGGIRRFWGAGVIRGEEGAWEEGGFHS